MTLFSAGKLLLCDFNCVHAMFLVYNNPGNLNNVLAMHLVSNSFAFKSFSRVLLALNNLKSLELV